MLTFSQVASNPAVLKTREGLEWLIGYSRAICDDAPRCNLSFEDVMDALRFDIKCDQEIPNELIAQTETACGM